MGEGSTGESPELAIGDGRARELEPFQQHAGIPPMRPAAGRLVEG
jgi:hypothetical protein